MDVYLICWICSVLDFVVENIWQNVGFVKFDVVGFVLDEVYVLGILFFMLSIGVEVMWNMKMCYCGVGVEIFWIIFGIFLCKGGEWLCQLIDIFFFMFWGKKGSVFFLLVGCLENVIFFNYFELVVLVGQFVVQIVVVGEQVMIFYYFFGQCCVW